MKKCFLFFYFSLSISDISIAQSPLIKQWDNGYGGTDYDGMTCFRQTSDGGYIAGGYSYSGIGGDKTQPTWGYQDFWIVKIDSLGTKQWDKDFGGTDVDQLNSLQQTSDGGYILGGGSTSDSSGDKTQPTWGDVDFWIVKIDSLGIKQWDKDFGGILGDGLFSLQQTKDGGYILGGVSLSDSSGDRTEPTRGLADYWIVKTDSLGNKQWDKSFGGSGYDQAFTIQQTFDGGYILGGESTSDTGFDKSATYWGYGDYWLIKIDSAGNKLWDKSYGGTEEDLLWSLQQTSDSGFILGGISGSDISGNKTTSLKNFPYSDYWIIKTDSHGNKQWEKDFGGSSIEEDFGNITQTSDGGYLISGGSYSDLGFDKTENNLGRKQTWIIKTDSLGNKQWDKTLHTYTSIGTDGTGFAIQADDGCYTMANSTKAGISGDKTDSSQGSWDYWVIKFCDSTFTTTISPTHTEHFQFNIFPNPFIDKINFQPVIASNELISIQVFSSIGEKVFSMMSTEREQVLNLALERGIYFIVVQSGNYLFTQKIIKV